jgi:hypothetical protein
MCNFPRPVVIKIGKGNFILSPDRMPDNNLADIIELIPVLVKVTQVPVEGFELRPARNGYV